MKHKPSVWDYLYWGFVVSMSSIALWFWGKALYCFIGD